MHSQWRDCQEWSKIGLPFSTTSNEACKMYDAVLTQYVGWYDDSSVGGVDASLERLLQADPNFVMGKVLATGLELLGTGKSIYTDTGLREGVEDLRKTVQKNGVNPREKKHAEAVQLWAEGDMTGACDKWETILLEHPTDMDMTGACDKWETILLEHPTDMLALKMAHDTYFYLGQSAPMRDSVARVFPAWKPSMPHYSYLYGFHSFGLVETNFYDQAEKAARKGLELNQKDAWSTHSMAHVLEMGGRQDEGIAFMSTTMTDWNTCGMLACHNYWHWAVYHVEKGEYTAALDIYDNECGVRSKGSGALLDIVDACSLLYRLNMEANDACNRSRPDVACRPHSYTLRNRASDVRRCHSFPTFSEKRSRRGLPIKRKDKKHARRVLSCPPRCGCVDVGTRWEDLYETCRPHADDHILVFNDLHVLMSCLGAKQDQAAKKLVNSLKDFISEHPGTQSTIAKKVGVAMCEAFLAYDEGDFARAVDLLAPVRYQVVTIGGSNAQRDVFNLFLIHAAIKSPEKRHHQLARNLLLERKALKETAPMTDRLIAKAMAMHGD
ncbi:Tetratricopeptide repeat protein 38 [Branchiostoma belcheri]|nr:Tetratricopeptide repeat protein 38 [Branchiostoma belcheri]